MIIYTKHCGKIDKLVAISKRFGTIIRRHSLPVMKLEKMVEQEVSGRIVLAGEGERLHSFSTCHP